MERNLIPPKYLQGELNVYRYFVDEKCRLIRIHDFENLFYLKYANNHDDMWQFWINDDKLYCENVSEFRITFPLKTNP
jgi:hypothetical protein